MVPSGEILDLSLLEVARRLHRRGVLRQLGWAVCWFSGVALVYQIRIVFFGQPESDALIRLLLIIGLAAALVYFGVLLARNASLAEAAAVADTGAGLGDEFKSALWFAHHDARGADQTLVQLQISRATAKAAQLDPLLLIPGRMPRGLLFALPLALAAALLAWLGPTSADSWRLVPPSVPTSAAAQDNAPESQKAGAALEMAALSNDVAHGRSRLRGEAPASDIGPRAAWRPSESDWTRLEQATEALGGFEQATALAKAIKARDHEAAEKALQQLQQAQQRQFAMVDRPARQGGGRGDPPTRQEQSALQDLFDRQTKSFGLDADKSAESDLMQAMKAAAERESNEQAPPGQETGSPNNYQGDGEQVRPDAGEQPGGVTNGLGQGDNPGGNSNVAENATGQQLTQSAMADGVNPSTASQSLSQASIPAPAVEGQRTDRLAERLRQVRIDAKPEPESAPESAEQRRFAATSEQRSRLDYRSVTTRPGRVDELVTTGVRIPQVYRAVVRDYFLNLRQAGQ